MMVLIVNSPGARTSLVQQVRETAFISPCVDPFIRQISASQSPARDEASAVHSSPVCKARHILFGKETRDSAKTSD